MSRVSRHLRLVPPPTPAQRGPGLARGREDLDARLGRLLREAGELADTDELDDELFTYLASVVHTLALAQQQIRRKRRDEAPRE